MKKDNPYYDQGMWKDAPSTNFVKAEALRENMTAAEKLLWYELQIPPFKKYRFRRQHPVQQFIVDFYSHRLRLAIEVDGKYHDSLEQKKLDLERTEVLEFNGLQIVRFNNEEVFEDIKIVLENLKAKISFIDETFSGSL